MERDLATDPRLCRSLHRRNSVMNRNSAPRSIDEYLKHLRAEVAAHPGKSEADVLELISSTYGAPDEVAAAYRDTEVKVKAALRTPPPRRPENPSVLRQLFGVYSDPRAY